MLDLTKIPFEAAVWFDHGATKKQYITIHCMAGYFEGSKATFKNKSLPKGHRVSANYLISKEGHVLNMVKDSDTAWACMGFNSNGISIEHEDQTKCESDPHWITPELWKASTELTAALMKKHGIKLENVMGHNDPRARAKGNNHSCPGKFFSLDKYRADVQAILDATH